MKFLTAFLVWMVVPIGRGRAPFHANVLHRVKSGKCMSDFVIGENLEKQLGLSRPPVTLPLVGCNATAKPANFSCYLSHEVHALPYCKSTGIGFILDCPVCFSGAYSSHLNRTIFL